jgi:TonB family protein
MLLQITYSLDKSYGGELWQNIATPDAVRRAARPRHLVTGADCGRTCNDDVRFDHMATADHDHYETLGVTSDATPQQVHDAYRSLIRVHRDRPGEPDPVRIERARRINIAHTILQNPVKRRQYDDSIAGPAGATLLKTPQSALPNDGWKGADFGDDSEEPMRQRKRSWYPLGVALIALGATTITLVTFYPTPIFDHLPARVEADVNSHFSRPGNQGSSSLSNGIFTPLPTDKTPASTDPQTQQPSRLSDRAGGVPTDGQVAVKGSAVPPLGDDASALAALATRPRADDPGATVSKEPGVADKATLSPVPAPLAAPVDRSARTVDRKDAPARWLGGGLTDGDNMDGQLVGTVGIRFVVEPKGSISNCRAERSSGDPRLDQLTCQLLTERLRFDPATNAQGKAVPSEVRTTTTWGRRDQRR